MCYLFLQRVLKRRWKSLKRVNMHRVVSKKFYSVRKYQNPPDLILAGGVAVLVFLGMIFLASASSVFSFKKFGNAYFIVGRQIIYGLLPGLLLLGLFSKLDYHRFERHYRFFFFLSVVALLLVFVPGVGNEFGTARSWIVIGGVSFQPSELVKLTFLIFLSGWIQRKGRQQITTFRYGLIPFLLYLGVIVFLIILQPDFGTTLILIFASVVVFFIAGARFFHLFFLSAAGIAAAFLLFLQFPYIHERIMVFLNPEADVHKHGYQVYQSFLAIGSGGLFGKGFGKSQQKFFYLPEVSSDSIFAVIAEETGFVMVVVLIILFLLILYRGVVIAKNAPDPFGRFLAFGISSWIFFQAFFNMAVMTGLAPLTGIPLPFISAGGSSLAMSLAAVGILINISKQRI